VGKSGKSACPFSFIEKCLSFFVFLFRFFSFFFVFREIFRESGWQGNPDEGELFWKSRYPVPLRLFE